MQALTDELYALLKKQHAVHSRLCSTAASMNAALKERDVTRVQALSTSYDETICNLETLEERRLELCDAIAAENRWSTGHMSLIRIVELLEGEQKKKFTALREELKRKISELSQINTSNQILLTESLDDISSTFKMITESGDKLAGYKRQGKKDAKPAGAAILNRMA